MEDFAVQSEMIQTAPVSLHVKINNDDSTREYGHASRAESQQGGTITTSGSESIPQNSSALSSPSQLAVGYSPSFPPLTAATYPSRPNGSKHILSPPHQESCGVPLPPPRTDTSICFDDFYPLLTSMSKENLAQFILSVARRHPDIYHEMYSTLSLASSRRILVKNIPFTASDSEFVELFNSFGPIEEAAIAREGGNSKGFGFVTFQTLEPSLLALRCPLYLLGRRLYTKIAEDLSASPAAPGNRFMDAEPNAGTRKFGYGNEGGGVKIFIRGFTSKINASDLQSAFSSYGPIETVTIATDPQGNSRNFGFVTFVHASDANKAVTSPPLAVCGDPIVVMFAHKNPPNTTRLNSTAVEAGYPRGGFQSNYRRGGTSGMRGGRGKLMHSLPHPPPSSSSPLLSTPSSTIYPNATTTKTNQTTPGAPPYPYHPTTTPMYTHTNTSPYPVGQTAYMQRGPEGGLIYTTHMSPYGIPSYPPSQLHPSQDPEMLMPDYPTMYPQMMIGLSPSPYLPTEPSNPPGPPPLFHPSTPLPLYPPYCSSQPPMFCYPPAVISQQPADAIGAYPTHPSFPVNGVEFEMSPDPPHADEK